MLLSENTAHQTSLFGTDLLQQLDTDDPLLQLANIIPWSEFEQAFAKLMCQHFSGHKVTQLYAEFRNLWVTYSH